MINYNHGVGYAEGKHPFIVLKKSPFFPHKSKRKFRFFFNSFFFKLSFFSSKTVNIYGHKSEKIGTGTKSDAQFKPIVFALDSYPFLSLGLFKKKIIKFSFQLNLILTQINNKNFIR